MQVHLDAPQTDLNLWGTGEKHDPYQLHLELEKTRNTLICLSYLNAALSGDRLVLSGFPTVRGFFIRLSEKDYDPNSNIDVKETRRQVDVSRQNHIQGVHMS